jgi:alkylated DNA repair protein (DNA oxidative demethylase)
MAHSDPMELRAGVRVWHGYLDRDAQEAMLADIRGVVAKAPLFRPVTARGRPMSVRMTSAGAFGWVSDRGGYRYEARHPEGHPWPPVPQSVLDVWDAVSEVDRAPQCCLVNYYDAAARMGLHQDRDEADFGMPVVSISLGDAALFRVGDTSRGGKTQSVWLNSGDVAVLSGEGRLAYHGVDRIRPGSSTLLPKGGRINLTLRVVE